LLSGWCILASGLFFITLMWCASFPFSLEGMR